MAEPQAAPERDRVAAVADWLAGRIPKGGLDERDPEFIRSVLPAAWLAASLWYRADVQGLERIPASGPVLLVGNHSGGNMTPDTMVFTLAFCAYFGADRPFYQLAHNLVMAQPGLQSLRRFGMMVASEASAEAALDRGAAVLVYPGGDWEVHRPSSQSARVDFAGRRGFVRVALRRGVPIVPVVSVGGQETALFLSRGDRLARWLRLDRLLRLKVLPISLALPWGVDVGDFLGHLPLPAKLSVRVLEPVDLTGRLGPDPDPAAAGRLVESVMQSALDAMVERRRRPVFG
ncbi:MAG TPA: 1-acyl-sn-glycerol-3-phosphate acyltransferase [Acidimicrobiales bacterium]|nr:1-acyl-sn-glycerol-3-phosphate acyltransferase [Acidimicrobiales bacterium]